MCRSCERARNYVRKRPELTKDDTQSVADGFFAEIISELADVIEEPSIVVEEPVTEELSPKEEIVEEIAPAIHQKPADVATIPFHGSDIQTVGIDGEPYVVFRPLVESIGLDPDSQMKRLRRKSWACTVMMTAQLPSDTQRREHTVINLKTLTMWLATIDEDRVNEASRPLVVAYQNEVAEAIESYWTKGTAINPRVVESKPQDFSDVILESKQQLELLKAAEGLVDPDHLRAKASVILARGLGEAPQLDPVSRPVYAQDFLRSVGENAASAKSHSSDFGRKLKQAYVEEHGVEPNKHPQTLSNGQTYDVYSYTERDRPLMERVWEEKKKKMEEKQ